MPLEDFFQEDGITRNVLQQGEIVTRRDSKGFYGVVGSYQKLRHREAWDFPVGCRLLGITLCDGTPVSFNMASTGFESILKHHDLVETISKGPDCGSRTTWGRTQERVRPVLNVVPPSISKENGLSVGQRAMEEASKDLLRRQSYASTYYWHGYRHWTRWPGGWSVSISDENGSPRKLHFHKVVAPLYRY